MHNVIVVTMTRQAGPSDRIHNVVAVTMTGQAGHWQHTQRDSCNDGSNGGYGQTRDSEIQTLAAAYQKKSKYDKSNFLYIL